MLPQVPVKMKRSLEPDEFVVERVVDKKLLTVLRHVFLSLSLSLFPRKKPFR